ncbi:hypothetical protein JKG47_22645, partial [Acidithiobacillus sp. MC6.1]|nr:hypothetical protein [Acidithiobacillus sp. MC6.1]
IGGIGGVVVSGGGGIGVVSMGNSIINGGAITGGKAANGAQANAVSFFGGGNTLELENGYSFGGNVVSTSGTTNGGDTLDLGGNTNAGFAVSNVVPSQSTSLTGTQYVGFNHLEEDASTGTTWTITGTNNSGLGWDLNGGILSVSSANALGSAALTFN